MKHARNSREEASLSQGLRKADAVTGMVLSLFGLAILLVVFHFRWDLPSVQRDGWYTAPGLLPGGAAVILVLQGMMLTIQALRGGGKLSRDDLNRVGEAFKSPVVRRAAIVAALLSLYVFGMVGRIHFALASFLFLAAFMFVFKAGAWWKILLIAAATSSAIAFVFDTLARIPLP